MKSAISLSLSFAQILELFRQLPKKQKILLTRELEKDVVDSRLKNLLANFKTDQLSLDIINDEVEIVRQNIYARSKKR